jgi:hypothetical protein
VTLPITFGTQENYQIERLHFEVASFETSYHAILGKPALAKFMAMPNHTYLVLKMPVPNGVISFYGDLKTSHSYETKNINLSKALKLTKNSVLVVESAKKIPLEDLTILENDSTAESQLKPGHKTKAILLKEDDPDKTALIGTGRSPPSSMQLGHLHMEAL